MRTIISHILMVTALIYFVHAILAFFYPELFVLGVILSVISTLIFISIFIINGIKKEQKLSRINYNLQYRSRFRLKHLQAIILIFLFLNIFLLLVADAKSIFTVRGMDPLSKVLRLYFNYTFMAVFLSVLIINERFSVLNRSFIRFLILICAVLFLIAKESKTAVIFPLLVFTLYISMNEKISKIKFISMCTLLILGVLVVFPIARGMRSGLDIFLILEMLSPAVLIQFMPIILNRISPFLRDSINLNAYQGDVFLNGLYNYDASYGSLAKFNTREILGITRPDYSAGFSGILEPIALFGVSGIFLFICCIAISTYAIVKVNGLRRFLVVYPVFILIMLEITLYGGLSAFSNGYILSLTIIPLMFILRVIVR